MNQWAKKALGFAMIVSWAALLWSSPAWVSYAVGSILLAVGVCLSARAWKYRHGDDGGPDSPP